VKKMYRRRNYAIIKPRIIGHNIYDLTLTLLFSMYLIHTGIRNNMIMI
jgi:hypothetical protein